MKSFCVVNCALGCAAGEALGAAAVELFGEKIAILNGGDCCGSIASGVKSAGGTALTFGGCFEAQIHFIAGHFEPDAFFFVSGEDKLTVSAYSAGALQLSPELQDEMNSLLTAHAEREQKSGETVFVEFGNAYYRELLEAGECLENIRVNVKSGNFAVSSPLKRAVLALGGELGGKACFCLSSSGLVLSAVDENGAVYTNDRLLDICCACTLEDGENITVNFSACDRLEEIAAAKGAAVFRSFEGGDELWQRDGVFLAIRLMHFMSKLGLGLCTLAQKIRPQIVLRKNYHTNSSLGLIADTLECEQLLTDESGTAFLRNGKGKIYLTAGGQPGRLCAEIRAETAEIAQELSLELEQAML